MASRRKSERLISAGRVEVDGHVVTTLGTRVDPARQKVRVDGRPVEMAPPRWLLLNKPPGYLCARSDPDGRPTVYDLLPADAAGLFHVGRLDYMSEGLLLLTNDGDTAHELLHPSREVARRYEVTLVGPVDPALPDRLVQGVALSDGPAKADSASLRGSPDGDAPLLEIELHEGRNREIRRMLARLGVTIRRLKRVGLGSLRLGDLEPGAHRLLDSEERDALIAKGRA